MNTNGLSRRVEKVEKTAGISEKKLIVSVVIFRTAKDSDLYPDVFDRLLEEWELWKSTHESGSGIIVVAIDPVKEAELRGGEFPLVPWERYRAWIAEQRQKSDEMEPKGTN